MNAVLTDRVNHNRTKSEKGFVKGTDTSGSNRSAMRLAMKSVPRKRTPKVAFKPDAIADLAMRANEYARQWAKAKARGDVRAMHRFSMRHQRVLERLDRLREARKPQH